MDLAIPAALFAAGAVYCGFIALAGGVMSTRLRTRERLVALATGAKVEEKPQKKIKQKKKETAIFNRIFGAKLFTPLAPKLELAGIPLRSNEFAAIWLISACGPAAVALLFRADILICLALVLLGGILPRIALSSQIKKQLRLFEAQLGEALVIASNCMRAGFSFQQAMESIAKEMPEPISREFSKVLREMKYGLGLERALTNMLGRVKSDDLDMLVTAVLVQRQVGGNLAEILDGISETIRERLRIKGEIRVLTSQGRTSGSVIGLLPVFIMGILLFLNPSYIRVFFETSIGIVLLCVAAGLEFIGFFIVSKIVNIKF